MIFVALNPEKIWHR